MTSLLENLAKMEYMYIQLLQSTKSLCSSEKEVMEQKYISFGDSIRRRFLPEGSSVHGEQNEGIAALILLHPV